MLVSVLQAAQCILAANACGTTSLLNDLPSHYVAEIMSSWRTVVKWNTEQEPSLFHRHVTAALNSMSITCEEKILTEDRYARVPAHTLFFLI